MSYGYGNYNNQTDDRHHLFRYVVGYGIMRRILWPYRGRRPAVQNPEDTYFVWVGAGLTGLAIELLLLVCALGTFLVGPIVLAMIVTAWISIVGCQYTYRSRHG